MRRGAVLSALLLTALLLYLWPGLLKGLWTEEDNRMADELRPAQRRDLTLWWIPGETGDQRCISRLCSRAIVSPADAFGGRRESFFRQERRRNVRPAPLV